MTEGWLSKNEVAGDAKGKIATLGGLIGARAKSAQPSYEHAYVSQVVSDSLAAGQRLRLEWFFSSLGIQNIHGEKQTWYFVRHPIGINFINENVVHWSHWIGRVYVQVKEALQDGNYPALLKYGPPTFPTKILERAVGPLVDYQFESGKLCDFEYNWYALPEPASAPVDPPTVPAVRRTERVKKKAAFALKDIVQLRDITQEDRIRGQMAGICLITGGPGVGKTSVALHRIPYLLLQQQDQLKYENPDFPDTFFEVASIQVVVWKEHLVRYLEGCLAELHFGQIQVHHIEDWVASRLRAYMNIGPQASDYRIKDEVNEFERMKLGMGNMVTGRGVITPELVEEFLTGKDGQGAFWWKDAGDCLARYQELRNQLIQRFNDVSYPVRLQDYTGRFIFTASGVVNAVVQLRQDLDRIGEEIRLTGRNRKRQDQTKLKGAMTWARQRVSAFRSDALDRLSRDFGLILTELYTSDLTKQAFRRQFPDDRISSFTAHVEKRADLRWLSRADRYVLLWVIHVLTRNEDMRLAKVGEIVPDRLQPLPLYSHTVVDEAQYYHPLVLRLLVALAKPPLRSMTIVGDLEQKVSQDEGLLRWDEIGISFNEVRVRLTTNYRWSKEIYQFVEVFKKQANLSVHLQAPKTWPSGQGTRPSIQPCDSPEDEQEWLIQQVTQIRRECDWSIAVVMPTRQEDDWSRALITDLAQCDIRARWAVGEDVRACLDQVIITNYESVVGLEFDAVFLPRCEEKLPPGSPDQDAIQAVWVALTRAKQFLAISFTREPALFSRSSFSAYQSPG